MTNYSFYITGPIKPYTRMTRRGKWVSAKAQAYLASKTRLQWEFVQQMQANGWEMIPSGIPLKVIILITPIDRRMDLDNLAKAIVDAAQGVVLQDDRWVDTLAAHRSNAQPQHTIQLTITPLTQ